MPFSSLPIITSNSIFYSTYLRCLGNISKFLHPGNQKILFYIISLNNDASPETKILKFLSVQEPFCPPKPSMPEPVIAPSSYHEDLVKLFEVSGSRVVAEWKPIIVVVGGFKIFNIQDSVHTDVIFVCGSVGFSGHKFLLSAGIWYFLYFGIRSFDVWVSKF